MESCIMTTDGWRLGPAAAGRGSRLRMIGVEGFLDDVAGAMND